MFNASNVRQILFASDLIFRICLFAIRNGIDWGC